MLEIASWSNSVSPAASESFGHPAPRLVDLAHACNEKDPSTKQHAC